MYRVLPLAGVNWFDTERWVGELRPAGFWVANLPSLAYSTRMIFAQRF